MKKVKTDTLDSLLDETEFDILIMTRKKTLILEGTSDLNFFRILLEKATVPITPFCINGTDSKNQLIELFTKHPEIHNNKLFLGIIDRDHDQNNFEWNNLLLTDFADLDCYYVYFSGFENFAREYLNNSQVAKLIGMKSPSQNIIDFRRQLVISIKLITLIRLINNQFRVPLGKIFKKSPITERKERYKKFKKILGEDNTINEEILFTYLRSSGHCGDIDLNGLKENIQQKLLESDDQLEISTNGHDLISYITCLHNLINTPKNDVQVEEALRLTVQITMFNEFPLTKEVADWIMEKDYEANKLVAATAE